MNWSLPPCTNFLPQFGSITKSKSLFNSTIFLHWPTTLLGLRQCVRLVTSHWHAFWLRYCCEETFPRVPALPSLYDLKELIAMENADRSHVLSEEAPPSKRTILNLEGKGKINKETDLGSKLKFLETHWNVVSLRVIEKRKAKDKIKKVRNGKN